MRRGAVVEGLAVGQVDAAGVGHVDGAVVVALDTVGDLRLVEELVDNAVGGDDIVVTRIFPVLDIVELFAEVGHGGRLIACGAV